MVDKKKAVVDALEGLAKSFGQLAQAHIKAQDAITDYSEEIRESVEPQTLLSNFPALFGNLETVASNIATKAKAAPATEAVESAAGGEVVEGDGQKRKRGPNKEKKIKDPNAPKRPASAYIEYQNSVRDDFRARYSTETYAEILKKIGHAWAEMTDDEKKPFHDIMEAKKATYLVDKKAYEAEHGPPQTVPAGTPAEPKEYTGKKRGRKSNAERAAMAAAAAAATASTSAPIVAEPTVPKPQADIPVDAPSKKVAEDSDDDSEDDSDSDSSDSEDDSEDESEPESSPAPAPVVVAPSKKDKKVKVDKHKAKKPKTA